MTIASAALRLMPPPAPVAAQSTPAASAGAVGELGEDDDRALLQSKIDAQQQEVDRLLEIYNKQKADLGRLRDELQSGPSEKNESSKGKEAKQLAKDRLRETEQHIKGLSSQLQASQEASDQAQDLRGQLRNAAERSCQRGTVLGEMQSAFEYRAGETALLRERLHLMQEDLHGLSARRGVSRQKRLAEVTAAEALIDATADPASSSTSVLDDMDSQLAADLAAARLRHSRREIAVQADLSSEGLAARSERRRLRVEIEDVRIEKALVEKRMARDVQEL